MKSVSERSGLSARRKTFDKIKRANLRIRPVSVFIVGLLIFSSCHEKTNGQNSAAAGDSRHKPKVNIKVNKHYDDKGNVVGFDSTYTSYYSNIKGDTAGMDSLMGRFDRYFNRNHTSFFRNEFDPLFFGDSLRYPDFFHKDFFMKRYELNDQYMRDMMQRMDSIKNHFFYKEHGEKEKGFQDL